MPPLGIPEETKQGIREMVAAGHSHRDVAKAIGVSISTVAKFASDLVPDRERSRTQNANEARSQLAAVKRDFDHAARIELLNEFTEKIRDILERVNDPRDLKDLAVALAVTIDKRRLEDGDATSRTETIASGARDRLAHRIDELAARRRPQPATG